MRQWILGGIAVNVVAKAVTFSLTTATGIVVARNLGSADYGIAGFAFIFINFLIQFGDFGLNSAVIQRKDLDPAALSTAFTIKALLAFLLAAALFLGAPLARRYFDADALSPVLQLLSVNLLVSIFAFQPQSMLSRELSYGRLIAPQIGAAAVNAAVTIATAVRGFGCWSMVFGNVAALAASTVLLNIIRPLPVRFVIDRQRARELLRYGGRLFLHGLIIFAVFNADNLVVGSVAGPAALGSYALAFTWGSLICGLLTTTVLVVLFPAFSRFQEDRLRIGRTLVPALHAIAAVSILVNLALFAVSREFLYVLLGQGTDKWLPALNALRIFCLYGVIRSVLEPLGTVLAAIGRTGPLLRASAVAATAEIALLYPVLRIFGITGVAALVTASYALQYLIYVPLIRAELGLGRGEILRAVAPAAAAGILAALAAWLPDLLGAATERNLRSGALRFASTLVLYVAVYGFLSRGRLWRELRASLLPGR